MYFVNVLLLLTLGKWQRLLSKVSKTKAAVLHGGVWLTPKTSKRHSKETQVIEPKVAVVHAKIFVYA